MKESTKTREREERTCKKGGGRKEVGKEPREEIRKAAN